MFRKPPVRLLPTTSLKWTLSWFLSSSGNSKDCHHLHTLSVFLTQSTMLDCLKTFDLCTVLVLLLLVFKLLLPCPLSCPTLGHASLHVTKVIKTTPPSSPFWHLPFKIEVKPLHYTERCLTLTMKSKIYLHKRFWVFFCLSQFQPFSNSR